MSIKEISIDELRRMNGKEGLILQGCGDLKSVYCNNLKVVEKRGFYSCREMDTIDLSQLEEAGEYAFDRCMSITAIYNDKLTTIRKCSFESRNHFQFNG